MGWRVAHVGVFIGLSGEYIWHFVSGMETALVVVLTLWTLYAVVRRKRALDGRRCLGLTLLALMRPEGGMLAVIAAASVVLSGHADDPRQE